MGRTLRTANESVQEICVAIIPSGFLEHYIERTMKWFMAHAYKLTAKVVQIFWVRR